jgi:hypothetical protein
MSRLLALIAALLLTALAVSSTSIAGPAAALRFTIEPSGRAGEVDVRFERERNGQSHDDWSSSFALAELSGLDRAALDAPVARPISLALVREAGRLDCAGTGGNTSAHGTCSLTPDPTFLSFLAQHGIRQPDEDQVYGLIALNVHRSLIAALGDSRYPTPSIGDLMGLTAVGVTPSYVRGLAAAGYRPASLDTLLQFAALKITPQYIGSFVRAGYSNLPPEELVQLKAMSITPDFIAGFERLGYGRLPVETLVELKAVGVTPDFVRSVEQGGALPSPERLVELRTVGRELRNR